MGARSDAWAVSPRRKLPPGPGMPSKDVAAHQTARIQEAVTAIVAERGYRALKVRDVVRHAGVSTRAFYDLFGSKEECFLRTYESVSRRAIQRMIAAQVEESDWRRRAGMVIDEFLRGLKREDVARLALIEAYRAGDQSIARAWQLERTLEGMIAESLARPPGVVVPPLILEGVIAGIASVAKRRLIAGEVQTLRESGGPLIDWALCHVDASAELAELDRGTVWRDTTLEPLSRASVGSEAQAWFATGDRALVLKAVAALTAKHGYAKLTVARVRAAASVSRRKFDAYFDGLEDSYLAALEQNVAMALAQASRAQAAAGSWAGGVYRAIAALGEQLSNDPFLFRVLLTGDFPQGPDGVRFRRRTVDAIAELLYSSAPTKAHSHPAVTDASLGAVWSLSQRHLIRERGPHQKISASLSYLVLLPYVSGAEAIAAMRDEQSHSRLSTRAPGSS